jgi:hypothetical protein
MKILSSASSHPEMNPNPLAGLKWMPFQAGGIQGSLPQDGNGKHGVGKHGMLGGFGIYRT